MQIAQAIQDALEGRRSADLGLLEIHQELERKANSKALRLEIESYLAQPRTRPRG